LRNGSRTEHSLGYGGSPRLPFVIASAAPRFEGQVLETSIKAVTQNLWFGGYKIPASGPAFHSSFACAVIKITACFSSRLSSMIISDFTRKNL